MKKQRKRGLLFAALAVLFLLAAFSKSNNSPGVTFLSRVVCILIAALFGWLAYRKFKPASTSRSAPDATTTSAYTRADGVIEFRCPGVHYHHDEIMSLARTSKKWKQTADEIIASGQADQKIFRYWFMRDRPRLVPEPTNPHDPNAVYVEVAGVRVGYVPADLAPDILGYIKNGRVSNVDVFIGGGPFKVVSASGEVYEDAGSSLFVSVRVSLL